MAVIVLFLVLGGETWAQRGGWSTPQMISTNTVSSWFSDVAVDGWGQPHVVWYSGRPKGSDSMDLLMYSSIVDGQWLVPNDVVLTAEGGYTVRPAVAIDDTQVLHVTFRGETAIYYTQVLASEGWDAASWSPRKKIDGGGTGSSYYSDIEVDEQGTIHVLWNEGVADGLTEPGIWLGTAEGAVLYTGGDLGRLRARLDDRVVFAMFEDQSGVQWFGTDWGVYRFDGVTWQSLTVNDGLAGPEVYCISQDRDGGLWFGTNKGLSSYREREEDVSLRWRTFSVHDGLPGNSVRAIAIDQRATIWAGTDKGLARYDGRQWIAYTTENGLVDDDVLDVTVDEQGDVWAATKNGVSQYDGLKWSSHTTENGLPSNIVTALAVDREGAIWCGTDQGLYRLIGRGRTSPVPDAPMPTGAVTAVMVDGEGAVWVATEDGVSYYEDQTWKVVALADDMLGKRIISIAEDRQLNAMCPLCSDIFYRHSSDGGKTWSAPANLSQSFAGSTKPQLHVRSGGDVYAIWEEGEDWYLHQGYPTSSMYTHSSDGGNTWAQPTILRFSQGTPQQITLGVGPGHSLVIVWRVPTESRYYYQVSEDDGASWSQPQYLPGVIAKAWEPFNLDAYHADSDSAGNIHLLVLGRYQSPQEELGLYHLVWDGTGWSSPTRIYASADQPEWPRIDVGAGNEVCATWFTRDREHIYDSARGRYQIWASCYQAPAPRATPPPLPTPRPSVVTSAVEQVTSSPVVAVETAVRPDDSGLPPGLYTDSDDIGRLVLAFSPVIVIVLVVAAVRFGLFRRRL